MKFLTFRFHRHFVLTRNVKLYSLLRTIFKKPNGVVLGLNIIVGIDQLFPYKVYILYSTNGFIPTVCGKIRTNKGITPSRDDTSVVYR